MGKENEHAGVQQKKPKQLTVCFTHSENIYFVPTMRQALF